MSNFSPKLEDATEDQLRYMVNELDFRVVPLASDELTRRSLAKLQKTIEKFNEQSSKLEEANYRLQVVMVILTSLGTFAIVFPIAISILKNTSLSIVTLNIIASVVSLVAGMVTRYFLLKRKM